MKWLMLAILLTTSGEQEYYAYGPRWDTLEECQFTYYTKFPLLIAILKEQYGPNAKLLKLSCVTTDVLDELEVRELEV